MADALSDVVTELYALPLAEFTTARNKRAADARASGDRNLADRIKQLRKPSTSAWAVNMLSRHRSTEVGQLLELGASLRAAQSELDAAELRELGTQRQKLVSALVRQARALADELGVPIGAAAADEVGQTLQAALADPDAADAVLAGLLTKPLAASGWGTVDVESAVAVAAPTAEARVTSITAKQIAKAKRRVADAEGALARSEADVEKLGDAMDTLELRDKGLRSELDKLEARIAELQGEITTVDRERDSLERKRERALATAEDAASEVEDAEASLKRLC